MDKTEHQIEQWFDEILRLPGNEEDRLWKGFEGDLPARQGWLGFHIAMEEAGRALRQAMTWSHYPLPQTTRTPH